MKQIYAYILLTTIFTLSTTCMEKEHNIQETESLLQPNSLIQPDKDSLKRELYTVARELDKRFDSSKLTTHKSLITFITLMNQAKRFNISEYDMAKYTYSQNKDYDPTPLYFHCLKKYNSAKEKLPFTLHDLNNEFCNNSKLAQALKITYKYNSMQDVENAVKNSRAYVNLISKLKIAANQEICHNLRSNYYFNQALCIALHAGTKILFHRYPDYNDITDFDDFYATAYGLQYPCYQNTYLFIALIERIKSIEKENDEKTMFSKILNYQPKPKEFFGFKYGSSVDTHLISTSIKNTIALMYRCVEQYHTERGDKITPTSTQHKAYLAFKRLDILLPDNFDKSVFDETQYAFKEFETFTDHMATIHSAGDADLEQSVKKLLQ